MALGDLIDVTTLLSYNYAGVTSNGNSATMYFDYNKDSGNYKGTGALTENTDGSLTFWWYDQNLQDAVAFGGNVYGIYSQFTWYTSNNTGIDNSANPGQQALVVSGGPIPTGTGSYRVDYNYQSIQNFANTSQIRPTFDAVQVPMRSNPWGYTNSSTIWAFRCRLWPTGPVGTSITLGNVSHLENNKYYNTVFNDSGGPTSGSLNLILHGATPTPVITQITPIQGNIGDRFVLTGTGFDPSLALYMGNEIVSILHQTSTSISATVPVGLGMGATTAHLSNGSVTSNSIAYTITPHTLYSGYSNEVALTFPAPIPVVNYPNIVGITIAPATTTLTEGSSQQFACIATYADASSETLIDSVTWSIRNISGVGSIDPSSGLFVAQTAGTEVDVLASVPANATKSSVPGHLIIGSGTATLNATAMVVIASRVIVPYLASIAIVPPDPIVPTGTQVQLQATGLSQLGGMMYPKVIWSVQNGLQRDPLAPLNAENFFDTGTSGSYTLASAVPAASASAYNGALTLTNGTVLVSSNISSYLSATEYIWYEWQALTTTGAAYGPVISDLSGNYLVVEALAGEGTVSYVDALGNTTSLGLLFSNNASTAFQHVFQIGLQRIDDLHTHLVVFIDDQKVYDGTVGLGYLAPTYPGFITADPSNTYIYSLRAFETNQPSVDGSATIDVYGLLTATQAGQITVYATDAAGSGIIGTTTVTITDPVLIQAPAHLGTVTVSPQGATCAAGSTVQFTAQVVDQYGNPYPDVSVTWSVVNTAGAGVIDPQSGLFEAQIAGSQIAVQATAYAIDDIGNVVLIGLQQGYLSEEGTASVVVVPGPIKKIAVTPDPVILQTGQAQQFLAYGYDSYNNQLLLTSAQWSVAGGIGTVNSTGLFSAVSSGTGKIIATQNGITGSAFANVLSVVGGVVVTTVPQQPFARVHIRDVVDAPLIVDARTRGGGLRPGVDLDTTDQFWWDIARYDGLPFQSPGVYATGVTAPGAQISPDQTNARIQAVLSKFGAPHFLPLIVPGSAGPATPF